MAHYVDDSYIEDQEIQIKDIIKIQALLRGALVRKWLKSTREDYDSIVTELEEDDKMLIEWPWSSPCIPCIRKRRKNPEKRDIQKNKSVCSSLKQNKVTNTSIQESPVHGCSPQERNHSIYKQVNTQNVEVQCTSSSRRDLDKHPTDYEMSSSRGLQTIETQTSFCDILPLNGTSDNLENVVFGHVNFPGQFISEGQEAPKTVKVSENENEQQTGNMYRKLDSKMESSKSGFDNYQMSAVDKYDNLQLSTDNCDNREVSNDNCDNLQMSKRQQLTTDSSVVTDNTETNTKSTNPLLVEEISLTAMSDSPQKVKFKVQQDPNSKRRSMDTHNHHPETSVITNASSVWDSFNSSQGGESASRQPGNEPVYPSDPVALMDMRKNIAMELLWVQQAIDSRKNYLKLKSEMEPS